MTSSDDYYLEDCEVRLVLEAKERESTLDAAARQMAREEETYQSSRREISILRSKLSDALDRENDWRKAALRLLTDIPAVTFICPLCGQHITDGKPCGCGAR